MRLTVSGWPLPGSGQSVVLQLPLVTPPAAASVHRNAHIWSKKYVTGWLIKPSVSRQLVPGFVKFSYVRTNFPRVCSKAATLLIAMFLR